MCGKDNKDYQNKCWLECAGAELGCRTRCPCAADGGGYGVFGLKDPKKCKSAKGYVWDGDIEQSIKVADKDSCSKNCRVRPSNLHIYVNVKSCYVTFCIIMFEYAF